jgi:6-phosphogluconolactonase
MNVSKFIIEKLNLSIEREGQASLVVSGGTSPISIYEELSKADISWSKVFLTLVDDRLVEPNHEDSNQNLLYKHLIKNKAKVIKFFPLDDKVRFNKDFKKPFDITLLGMGEDGHFASLFPNMINLPEAFSLKAKPKVLKTDALGSPLHPRITMNLSMIMESSFIILLVKGKLKQDVLDKANMNSDYPIHYLINNRNKKILIKKIND